MAGGKGKKAAAAGDPSLFADRLELRGMEYQRKVREGYLAQAKEQPEQDLVIDATKEPEAVFRSLLAELEKRIASK